MTIARTPKAKAASATLPVVDESKIDALINKGGSSILAKLPIINQEEEKDDEIKTVLLRTYESQVKEIDALLALIPKRKRPSRNAYIVNAIDAQIQRDRPKQK